MGTEVRVDWPEGKGFPISVKSSADPYFLCLWGGEGRKNNIMEPYSWMVNESRRKEGERKRGLGQPRFKALLACDQKFSVLQVMESWAGPGNEARSRACLNRF